MLWEAQGFAWDASLSTPNQPVESLQHRLGAIADFVYGSPSQALWMVGVTGTNGKTSCSQWIAQAFDALGRAVGERRAKEMVLSGQPISTEQAFGWGLVNRVCEPGKLLEEALATAQAIADNAPLSVRQAKRSIHYGLDMDLLTGYRFEIEAYNRLVDTDDRREGVRAFNEKRKPDFKGR